MTNLSGPATLQAIACARHSAQRTDRALLRFVKHRQPAVRRLASQHPRLADLALSFPALLFALAVPRYGFDPAPVIAMAIAGEKLKRLAAAAELPLWTRRLVPEAFDSALPRLPCGSAFTREIGNFLPRARHAARWLACVALTAEVADDGVALWMARHIERARLPFTDQAVRRVALWAWYSQHPDVLAGRLVQTRWTPAIGLAAARDAAWAWRERLDLHGQLSEGTIDDVWFEPGEVDGLLFEPLRTTADIEAIANTLSNCAADSGYADSCRRNRSRLWRVSKGHTVVALIQLTSVKPKESERYTEIVQAKGPSNARIDHATSIAICRWWLLNTERVMPARIQPRMEQQQFNQAAWNTLWRPYWLAKRRIPGWLPVSVTSISIYDL